MFLLVFVVISSCVHGLTTITCDDDTPCINTTIECPSNDDCQIDCNDYDSCMNSTVVCADNYYCDINCHTLACPNIKIDCPATHGDCDIYCGGTSSCESMTLNCGIFGDCNVECYVYGGGRSCTGSVVNCPQYGKCDIDCYDRYESGSLQCENMKVIGSRHDETDIKCQAAESCQNLDLTCFHSCNVLCNYTREWYPCQYLRINGSESKYIGLQTRDIDVDVICPSSVDNDYVLYTNGDSCNITCGNRYYPGCDDLNIYAINSFLDFNIRIWNDSDMDYIPNDMSLYCDEPIDAVCNLIYNQSNGEFYCDINSGDGNYCELLATDDISTTINTDTNTTSNGNTGYDYNFTVIPNIGVITTNTKYNNSGDTDNSSNANADESISLPLVVFVLLIATGICVCFICGCLVGGIVARHKLQTNLKNSQDESIYSNKYQKNNDQKKNNIKYSNSNNIHHTKKDESMMTDIHKINLQKAVGGVDLGSQERRNTQNGRIEGQTQMHQVGIHNMQKDPPNSRAQLQREGSSNEASVSDLYGSENNMDATTA